MAKRGTAERSSRGTQQRAHAHRLEPGHTYFDLDHPEQGPFIATGDEDVAPGANIVAREDMDEEAWEGLLAEGWGEFQYGAGDQPCYQGAFGQEDKRRMDEINAAPRGVGKR